jgi:hypothetical protein
VTQNIYPDLPDTDPTLKPTNPKDIVGSDKLPLHLWPETATVFGCLGMLDGALKYGRANWRETGVKLTIYVDACRRHLNGMMEGEWLDPDSGMPHLSHALACLAIIADAVGYDKLVNDGNYQPGDRGYRQVVDELTPAVAQLKARHSGKNPKHWTALDSARPEGQTMPGSTGEVDQDS